MASKFQTKIIKQYEKKGYFVLNLIKTNKNGIADLLCLKAGEEPIFIECKEKHDTIKPLQQYRGKEVLDYGCKFKLLKDGDAER